MIPHIRRLLSADGFRFPAEVCKKPKKPGRTPAPASERSAELPTDESRDASTGSSGHLGVPGLREHANDGLGAGRADEYAAVAVPLAVQTLDLGDEGGSQLLRVDPHVLLDLRKHGHRRGDLA